MAKVVPSGVIQLPDFAQLDYNVKQQKRQEQLQFDEYLSQFGEMQGNYLAADLEAVQGAYDNVENIMDKLAANPDDISLRRDLRNAFGQYSQVAGTAQFLANNNREQRALYATNPDNFSLTSDEAMGLIDNDARVKRNTEQIMSLASNPLALPMAYRYQLGSPTEVADEMFKDFSRIDKDFIKNDGSYDQDKITQWGNEWLAARYIDPEQKRNAIAYSALRQGKIGRNGKLTGRQDLDRLDAPEFELFRDPLLGDYNNQTIGAFMAIVPQKGVSDYQINQDRLRLAAQRNKAIADNKFFNLTGGPTNFFDVTYDTKGNEISKEPKGKGFMFPIEDMPIKLADGSMITSFGKLGDKDYVIKTTKETRENPNTLEKETILKEQVRPATTADRAALNRASNGLYDAYMQSITYSGEEKKQEQQAEAGEFDASILSNSLYGSESTSFAGGPRYYQASSGSENAQAGDGRMMSSSDIESIIPPPPPAPQMPQSAFGIPSGFFLTPEQRAQQARQGDSIQQNLIDKGIITIKP